MSDAPTNANADSADGPDAIDRLVRAALDAAGLFARKGSTLTTGVALIALVMTGAAYGFGLAAFDGSERTAWVVIGALLVIVGVGAPLLASFRLRSIPRHSPEITSELRGLLGRSDEAKRIVIDTVATSDGDPVAGSTMPSGRPVPPVVFQSQRYTKLRTITMTAGDMPRLTKLFHNLATLPGLVAIGLILSLIGSLLAFVFFLVWVF